MTHVQPFARTKPSIKVLKNKMTQARIPHTLKCGCPVKPGMFYHQVVALVNGRFTITRQHASGLCLEIIH